MTSRSIARDIHDGLAADEAMRPTIALPGANRSIGPESGRTRNNGIGVHRSPHGSVRYLYYVKGLQVVSSDGRRAVVANVYTDPMHRRRGIASKLLARARQDFAAIDHAPDRHMSSAGAAWANAGENKP